MSEELMSEIFQVINKEQIVYGECILGLVFRNGQIQKYSITTTKNTLVNSKKATKEELINGKVLDN